MNIIFLLLTLNLELYAIRCDIRISVVYVTEHFGGVKAVAIKV